MFAPLPLPDEVVEEDEPGGGGRVFIVRSCDEDIFSFAAAVQQ